MLLRMSHLFVRTLRQDPADAEVPSHRLLVRAGYVRRVAPGGYAWLPLGKLVLDRIAAIVREEMVAIGAQEVSLPSLLPSEPYEQSGRLAEYGPDLFRVRDRRGAVNVLGPTHEELFTLLVKDLYTSYRDYPVTLFQIGTKFRDEARPRGGPLRGREFLMKDAYSFDVDDAGLRRSYGRQRTAYQRIFNRLGLTYTMVEAVAGAMGGSACEEFQAIMPGGSVAGDDTFVACAACGYAANVEAVTTPVPGPAPDVAHPPLAVFDTPGTPTIESVVSYANSVAAGGRTDWTAADTLKNVVLDVAGSLLVVGVPGDREVDLKRVAAAVYPAPVELFDDFASYPDLVRGYIGPQVLRKFGIRYLVDPRVVPGSAWLTGANEADRHAVNVVSGRDFTPDGTIEAADVRAGDPCPTCTHPLALRRGIEIGHIFQLGRRFTDVFGLDALGPDGQQVRVTMGCYGIGISRAVAAIAEQHHDEQGLAWPASVAPAYVHLVYLGSAGQLEAADRLAAELTDRGIDVLLDDRPGLSAGVRFADADLLGMPVVVVIGRRLADGYVEVRSRIDGSRSDVPLDQVTALISHMHRG
jgi:prolyl-tRNA synthetase